MKELLKAFIRNRLSIIGFLATVLTLLTTSTASADRIDYTTDDIYEYTLVNYKEVEGDLQSPYAIVTGILDSVNKSYLPNYLNIPDYIEKDGVYYRVTGSSIYEEQFGSPWEYSVKLNSNCDFKLYGDTSYILAIQQSPNETEYSLFDHIPYGSFDRLQILWWSCASQTLYRDGGTENLDLSRFPALRVAKFPGRATTCAISGGPNYALSELKFGFNTLCIDLSNLKFLYLTDIYCSSPEPPILQGFNIGNFEQNVTIHVPVGCYDVYRNAEGWSNFETITADIDYDCNDCNSPITIDNIKYGFIWDNELEESMLEVIGPEDRNMSGDIYIPETVDIQGTRYTVSKIGPCAFMNCNNIGDVYIPETVKKIDDMAFYRENEYGGALGSVNITSSDSNLKSIGHYAFYNKPAFHVMPRNLKRIGNYAFYNSCTNTLSLNEGLEHIGDYAFHGNGFFYSIVIPSTVKYIGTQAFGVYGGIDILNHIEFKNSSIKHFNNASGFGTFSNTLEWNTTFEFPESVECVSFHATPRCKNIIIPENVKTVLSNSFTEDQEIWFTGDNLPAIWATSFSMSNTPNYNAKLHVKATAKCRYPENESIWNLFTNISYDVPDYEESFYVCGPWTFTVNPETGRAIITGYDMSADNTIQSNDNTKHRLIIPEHVTLNGVDYEVESIRKWAISDLNNNQWQTGYEIELPSTIASLDDYAISNTNIRNVYCKAMTPPDVECPYAFSMGWSWWDRDYYTKIRTTLYVPEGTEDLYNTSNFGKMFYSVIGKNFSSVKGIEADTDSAVDMTRPVDVFNLAGVRVYSGVYSDVDMPAGIYVIRQGDKATKIQVR